MLYQGADEPNGIGPLCTHNRKRQKHHEYHDQALITRRISSFVIPLIVLLEYLPLNKFHSGFEIFLKSVKFSIYARISAAVVLVLTFCGVGVLT